MEIAKQVRGNTMEIIEKPSKTKLKVAAEVYFDRNPNAVIVGIRTKEGREFFFRRNFLTGEPVKVSQAEAQSI